MGTEREDRALLQGSTRRPDCRWRLGESPPWAWWAEERRDPWMLRPELFSRKAPRMSWKASQACMRFLWLVPLVWILAKSPVKGLTYTQAGVAV